VVSFSISQLKGTLSYAAVLHDGCRFNANNIEIILEPVEALSPRKKKDKESKKKEDVQVDLSQSLYDRSRESLLKEKEKASRQSEEGQEGLTFIANWIEVVLARLQVTVEDLHIVINDPRSTQLSLRMHLSQATFFNTNPRMLDNRLPYTTFCTSSFTKHLMH
jgi:hypothetical protein